jgi:Asp-tRNA(Asn)/Glu-tRNA(Gln) amidotransferase A subunit family amidase
VRAGRLVSDQQYHAALDCIAEARERMVAQFAVTPIILVPAAAGPAPRGLASTGDPRHNSPWTSLGSPAISIPMGTAGRLPLGLQMVGARHDDARLLEAAVQVAAAIGPAARITLS